MRAAVGEHHGVHEAWRGERFDGFHRRDEGERAFERGEALAGFFGGDGGGKIFRGEALLERIGEENAGGVCDGRDAHAHVERLAGERPAHAAEAEDCDVHLAWVKWR